MLRRMTKPSDKPPGDRPSKTRTNVSAPRRRFKRTDGRFDLPVVTGRTPQQVARRLA